MAPKAPLPPHGEQPRGLGTVTLHSLSEVQDSLLLPCPCFTAALEEVIVPLVMDMEAQGRWPLPKPVLGLEACENGIQDWVGAQ